MQLASQKTGTLTDVLPRPDDFGVTNGTRDTDPQYVSWKNACRRVIDRMHDSIGGAVVDSIEVGDSIEPFSDEHMEALHREGQGLKEEKVNPRKVPFIAPRAALARLWSTQEGCRKQELRIPETTPDDVRGKNESRAAVEACRSVTRGREAEGKRPVLMIPVEVWFDGATLADMSSIEMMKSRFTMHDTHQVSVCM